ncbi:MAG: hypothetical protein HOP10_13545 [Chitinophagaceae bacterium]|nr:hypothetical protein [Chitinophagaceae bacterium]
MRSLSTRISLISLLFVVIFTGCNGCNPKTGFLAIIMTSDVPAGQTYTFQEPVGGLNTVDFIARIFYPATDSSGTEVAGTDHPLIIFGHGRFSGPGSGFPNNYLHASYLMKQLASWGYIVVTVNFDVVHSAGQGFGISERGELFLKAIDFMTAENGNASSKFHNKIDLTKIGLIGHSRGGGGATSAVNRNVSQGSPRSIKALATISPTDGATTAVANMPQLMIYGTWDGDLDNAPGYKLWDPAPRNQDKIYVEVYGANHFFFSDDLVFSSELNGISRENHQNIAKGFINAFFDKEVRGLSRFTWPEYLTFDRKVDTVEYYVQYMDKNQRLIDDGGPSGTATINTLTGTNTPTSMTLFDDANLGSGSGQHGSTIGLRMSWDAAMDRVEFSFPPQDVSGFDFISFRASQRHNVAGNTLNTFKTLKVQLFDAANNSFVLPVSNSIYKGLQYPDTPEYPGGSGTPKNIPSTFRLRLSNFTGVNLNSIVKVRILFDHPNSAGFVNNTGAITFDDIEFTK